MNEHETGYFAALVEGVRRGKLREPDPGNEIPEERELRMARKLLTNLPAGRIERAHVIKLFRRDAALESFADEFFNEGKTGLKKLRTLLYLVKKA